MIQYPDVKLLISRRPYRTAGWRTAAPKSSNRLYMRAARRHIAAACVRLCGDKGKPTLGTRDAAGSIYSTRFIYAKTSLYPDGSSVTVTSRRKTAARSIRKHPPISAKTTRATRFILTSKIGQLYQKAVTFRYMCRSSPVKTRLNSLKTAKDTLIR